MLLKIQRLYDSHVHWLGTGQIERGLKLFHVQSFADLEQLQIQPHHFRGEWLYAFGWDQFVPSKEQLDQLYPDFPVLFSRVDGHSSVLNTQALQKLKFPKDHSGFLSESAHFQVYNQLPLQISQEMRESLLAGMRYFNQAGFTHIRDMTCDSLQWKVARELDLAGELNLYVEENFYCEKLQNLDEMIDVALQAKAEATPHLRVLGIKIFFDGTLGSNTAYLSRCACNTKNWNWSLEDIEVALKKVWAAGLELAVHTIGDEAAHQAVLIARKLMATNQHTGKLNLEHVEVLRNETIQLMKAMHVRCHMQPCHWLSDRTWLKEKLGELYQFAFPWGALSKMQIPLSFGSDAPVAHSSYWDNERALRESVKEKIPALKGSIAEYHTHPDPFWGDTSTTFDGQKLKEIYFDGKVITKVLSFKE